MQKFKFIFMALSAYVKALQGDLCYVGEEGLISFLLEVVKLKSKSAVYIASGGNKSNMPLLCGTFQCFTKDDVWQPTTSLIPHAEASLVNSYVDFLITQQAYSFVGNRHSTFSMELYHIFRDHGKIATFVNELKCAPGKNITYLGCKPVNLLSCCT